MMTAEINSDAERMQFLLDRMIRGAKELTSMGFAIDIDDITVAWQHKQINDDADVPFHNKRSQIGNYK